MTAEAPSGVSQDGRLKELDGWRAISVLLVIVDHFCAYQHESLFKPHPHLFYEFQNLGQLGVRVFFVISGFVICRLLLREEARRGSVSLKAFYIRRAFRILPPFCVYAVTICIVLLLGLGRSSWSGILTGTLFLYDLVPARHGAWFIGHSWSLAVEEQFYLTFPAVFALSRGRVRKALVLAFFVLLAAWNFVAAAYDWNSITDPNLRGGFGAICGGVLLALFEQRIRAIARAIPALVAAVIALSLLWHPVGYFSPNSALFDCLYLPPVIALLLMFSLEGDLQLRRFLLWKPIQAIGLTSYGIYLWQELFTAPAKFYTEAGKSIPHLLPLLFVIVPFSYFLIEKPAMRFGRVLAERVRKVPDREEVAA